MTMNRVPNPLIDQLAGDLAPVRPATRRRGLALVAIALVVSIVGIAAIEGIWTAAFAGQASPFFMIVNGASSSLGSGACLGFGELTGVRTDSQVRPAL